MFAHTFLVVSIILSGNIIKNYFTKIAREKCEFLLMSVENFGIPVYQFFLQLVSHT